MEQRILTEMHRIVDGYFHVPDLNQLLKLFIQDKVSESESIWSEFTLCSHFMLGGNSDEIYAAAAHTELIILALDIVDDLQDLDNKDKPWMLCDPAYALNAVIAFLTASIGDMCKLNSPFVPQLLQLVARSINGQQRDINHSISTEQDYVTMVQEKSSSLINMAFYMGYVYLDEDNSTIIAQMDEIAQYIGMAAQIKNDTRDLLRLDLKNDLFQKKKTLPILFLLSQGEEKFPPLHLFYEGKTTLETFLKTKHECLQYIIQSGCIEYAKTIQFLYLNKVELLFDSLIAGSLWKDKLKKTVLAAIGN